MKMKLQAHIPGQISGRVANPAGPQLPGLSQPNGNALPPRMPNLGGISHSTIYMDPEIPRIRSCMQEKIFHILLQKQHQPVLEVQRRRLKDLAKRLEEGLFKAAQTKEEYMNLDTLEHRLFSFIKQSPLNNYNQVNQQIPQLVSSSPIGSMIPTPGMSHVASPSLAVASSVDTSMIASSVCTNIAPTRTSVNTGNVLPTGSMHANL